MRIKKFQEGGPMPADPAMQGGQPMPMDPAMQQGDPNAAMGPEQPIGQEEQLMQIAQEIISQLGPEGAAALAEIIMQMLQAGAQQEQPAFQRNGGRLMRIN